MNQQTDETVTSSLRPLSRRRWMQAQAGALTGLQLLSALPRLPAGSGRKTARSCVFLFMWGGPSQLDTLDPKTEAPAEIRGPFNAISTSVPGVILSEHFQQLSQRMDQVALIRSLNHDDPAHLSSAHCTLTGHRAPAFPSDNDPPSEKDTPHLGSVLSYLRQSAPSGERHSALPGFVSLPWTVSHPAAPGGQAPGQHGGWLGRTWDAFPLLGDPNAPNWNVPALTLMDGVSSERLRQRRALLEIMQHPSVSASSDTLATHQSRAVDLLTSPAVRDAFDLNQERAEVRDRYGRHIHGQSVLLARRLVEKGVPVIAVNWHNDGQNFWDTHGNNFNRLKNDLIPPADRALCALLDDLRDRGLLEETIVAWVGEFGRRPEISQGNAGREHWPRCYSGLLAGGGIRGGTVYGASDPHAAYPALNPVTPHDYMATILHAFGIPEDTLLQDREARPHRLYAGRPIVELFG